ncbi:NAD(P)H-binding domain-containing protein [Trichoderma breve]|uniref:NAD(P)H-binding domain-containing protein n=1 Tax=Trichoderma breve TaxID=2034170 RepID=A0A9W9EF95_9HYPO|nr:NAD(P)H-binding domain-containing protein [Trichoderma breve]KAJ4865579.1 NAD(P)H-binding domain-containing protein [Trichoderma breve]
MVRIALAGGSGGVGREILDALLETGKHNISVISRKENNIPELESRVSWVVADYTDTGRLADLLQGVDTVLSFIVVAQDKGNQSQRNLIDACVKAGVRRFAPSDWAGASTNGLPWYAGKTAIEQYLKKINQESKVLEYCCFRPGMLMNYLAFPQKTTKYADIWGIHIDMEHRRAIILGDAKNPGYFSMTTMDDVAKVVAKAVEYEGVWPEVGGIRGDNISQQELIALGEKIRGGRFAVETIKSVQARAGRLTATWHPKMEHPTVPEELRESSAKIFTAKTIVSVYQGSWEVSGEWNKIFPDYKFTTIQEFLEKWWADKE